MDAATWHVEHTTRSEEDIEVGLAQTRGLQYAIGVLPKHHAVISGTEQQLAYPEAPPFLAVQLDDQGVLLVVVGCYAWVPGSRQIHIYVNAPVEDIAHPQCKFRHSW